ncbi:MAG TPA: heme exporter protein CcmD [Salinisphaeraceae bacterium]|nr:heme exporter protein CcmD [Salinisphaeraceae bacterium]
MVDSLAQFVDMGGYAAYVWSSYSITLIVIAGNIVWPMVRYRQIRRRIQNGDYDD